MNRLYENPLVRRAIENFMKEPMFRYCTGRSIKSTFVGDQKINYIETGSGNQNVFCMPGAFGTIWTDFEPQIEGLNKHKFKVIVWDPPGYGDSRPNDRRFNNKFYENDADMAFQFLKKIGINKTSILGWSDGGISGLILSEKRPTLVEKLVVWGANAFITEKDLQGFQVLRDLNNWSSRTKCALLKIYTDDYLQKIVNDWCNAMEEFGRNGGNICKDSLELITCPTLILHGNKDPLVPSEHPNYLRKNIKNSRLYEFPEGKHNIHLRYAEEFNEVITEFLTSTNKL